MSSAFFPAFEYIFTDNLPRALPGIDRIEESRLTSEIWFKEYLAEARPLIVVHDTEESRGKQVESDLLKYCGDREVDLMTPQLKKFYAVAEKNPLKMLVSGFMYLLYGMTLDDWRRDRQHVPLKKVATISSNKAPSSGRISGLFMKLVPQMLKMTADLISAPPYLADLRPEVVCREVFLKKDPKDIQEFVRDDAFQFMQWTSVEQETGELLLARGKETGKIVRVAK